MYNEVYIDCTLRLYIGYLRTQCGAGAGGPSAVQMLAMAGFLPWPFYIVYVLYMIKKRLSALLSKSEDKPSAADDMNGAFSFWGPPHSR